MKKIIVLLVLCCLICCSCSSKEEKDEIPKYEGINISEIDSKDIINQKCTLDMNVKNVELDELAEEADIVIKGRLIKLDSNVDEQTNTMYTDYTFKVDKTYKGKTGNKIVINALGGIMKYDKYMNQVIKNKFASESDIDKNNMDKYVCFLPAGFTPLSPKGEYVIYANYNEEKECYYPTYYFYGIFNSDDGKKYKRYKIEEDDIDSVATIEKIEKSGLTKVD